MKRFFLLPALVALCGTLLDSTRELPEAYARPENTIASYWHRMIERRHAEALECFAHSAPEDAGMMLALPKLVELRCVDFRIHDLDNGRVDVLYTVEYRVSLTDSLAQFETGDRLHLTNRGWKIERPLQLVSRDSTAR